MTKPAYDYFDYAAATPLDEDVLQAMQPYFTERFYNPSATYDQARGVAGDLVTAREKLAYWLGVRPVEVYFTAGGTEANNLAIHGVMQQYPQANVVVSAIEHESVLQPAAQYDRRVIGVMSDGFVDMAALRFAIDDQTVLVSVMYANNEIGTIQPIRNVAKAVTEIRDDRRRRGVTLPLLLHTDACQAVNYLDIHAPRLGVDLMTINGGKIYGPKQSGVLYVRVGVTLRPIIWGGGQERGMRSGTENVAACIGLAAALEKAQQMRHDEGKRLQRLQQRFIDELSKAIPTAVINGSTKKRLPNNVHLTLPGQDNERLLIKLEQAGVLAAAGSACSASNEEPSHVLRALGLSDADARASLRFTMGRSTDEAAVDRAITALQKAVNVS